RTPDPCLNEIETRLLLFETSCLASEGFEFRTHLARGLQQLLIGFSHKHTELTLLSLELRLLVLQRIRLVGKLCLPISDLLNPLAQRTESVTDDISLGSKPGRLLPSKLVEVRSVQSIILW